MSELTPFTFPVTGEPIRTILLDDEPWFIASDVTAILGYSNGRDAVSRLPERMRGVGLADTPGGQQKMSVINEAGVYRLVMRSNLMAAEQFQDWLAEDVIPSIRKTGAYAVPALSNRDLALMVIAEADRADLAERRIAELAPAAASWEALASANGDYSVADAAKILTRDGITTGERRLFTALATLGWTYRAGDGRWRVKQTAVETGRLSELPSSHYHPRTGELVLDPPQVRVTVKGVHDLHRVLGAKALEASR
jgi:prophage antirepressor-like protein